MISGTVSTLAALFLLEGFLADEATTFKAASFLVLYLGVLISSFLVEACFVEDFLADCFFSPFLTDWEEAASSTEAASARDEALSYERCCS